MKIRVEKESDLASAIGIVQTRRRRRALIALALATIGALSIIATLAWYFGFRDFTGTKVFVGNLRDVVLSLAQVVAVLLLCAVMYLLISWMNDKGEKTVILPFANATGDPKYDGRAISDSLIAELQRISEIHQAIREAIESESLKLPTLNTNPESLASSLADVGSFGVGETKVSIGRLLLTLKQVSPFGDPGTIITGSLQKYGQIVRLVARKEHQEVTSWEVSRDVQNDNEIPSLIRDLAFKIATDLSAKTITAKSWIAFRHLSESLEAYDLYQQAGRVDDLEAARTNCIESARAERGYAKLFPLLTSLGNAYWNKEEYVKTEELYRIATTLKFGQSDSEKNKNLSQAFNGLGVALHSLDRNEEAENAYRTAIEMDPRVSIAYGNLGAVLKDVGDYDQAESSLRKALELDEHSAWTLMELGHLYQARGQIDPAIDCYKRACNLDPNSTDAHLSLGWAYVSKGDLDSALTFNKRALELDSKSPYVYIGIGLAHEAQGQSGYHEAVAAYSRSIALNPKSSDAYYNRGHVLLLIGDLTQAEADLEDAIRLDAKHHRAIFNLSILREKQGDIEEALELRQRSLDLNRGKSMTDRIYHAIYEFTVGARDLAVKEMEGILQENQLPAGSLRFFLSTVDLLTNVSTKLGGIDVITKLLNTAIPKDQKRGGYGVEADS